MKKDIITYHRYHAIRGRSRHASDQKPISAKIDNPIMVMLEAEYNCTGVKKNRIINLAIEWYLDELDEARKKIANGNLDDKYTLNVDISDLPSGELKLLEHICRGFGCEKDAIVKHLVRMMLQDYDRNPHKYMP